MPRNLLRRYLPRSRTFREHRALALFGEQLKDPNLWHLNRKSVSGALAIGLFVAFVPLPAQMLIAAAAAILVRVNLPIATITVWITNPLTMPFLFYFAYVMGTWVLGVPVEAEQSGFNIDAVLHSLGQAWRPFVLGCFIMGLLSAIAGFVAVRLYWRWFVIKKWTERQPPKIDPPPDA